MGAKGSKKSVDSRATNRPNERLNTIREEDEKSQPNQAQAILQRIHEREQKQGLSSGTQENIGQRRTYHEPLKSGNRTPNSVQTVQVKMSVETDNKQRSDNSVRGAPSSGTDKMAQMQSGMDQRTKNLAQVTWISGNGRSVSLLSHFPLSGAT